MSYILKELGENIKFYRNKNNLSQENLAIKSKLNRAFLSELERGRVNISILNLANIAQELQVGLKDLLDFKKGEDNPMNNFKIYYDSLIECEWFRDLNPIFATSDSGIIKTRGKNPDCIERLISYDRPDIILLYNNTPVLVIEKTSEVPTGHNVGQRFARLVKAVEEGILTIYYFPYDAMKHGKYAGMCNLNIRLIEACLRIDQIHKTPLLTVNWLTDDYGELITDGTENIVIADVIADFIKSGFNKHCSKVTSQMSEMVREYDRRLKIRPSYGKLPNSVEVYSTKDFCSKYKITNISQTFLQRPFTYVYKMVMTPDKCKRQDPYTGTQFIYDYIACRSGVSVSDKNNNLVLYFPKITQKTWFKKNPNNPNTKSCNWYLTANALMFSDSIYINIL